MKKLLLLALPLVMVGCTDKNPDGSIVLDSYYKERSVNNPYSCIIDSCEYIRWSNKMAHKGNCRYCAERRKQEIKKLIEEIRK